MKRKLITLLFALLCSSGFSGLLAQTASVQVIHNAADPAAAVVDIYIQYHGTEVKLDDVAFRTATGFLDLPSGTPINIIVAPANSQNAHQVIKAFHGITLEEGQTYQVVANGVVSHDFAANPEHRDIAFNLFIAANARTSGTSDENVDLRVFHGSTDAPRVGVNANGNTIISGFSYGDFTDYLSVPAGVYELEVTPAGAPENALFTFTADISGLGGGAATILASGFVNPAANQNGPAFGLIAVLADGTVIELPVKATARAQVIHNSADPAAEVVDVYVKTPSDTIKIDDFTFRTATPFIDLPAGVQLEIVVAGANSESITDGIASFNAGLKAGASYYIVASGVLNPDDFAENPIGQETGFTLLIKEGARESAIAGYNVDVQILHGSTDAPGVGINFDDRVIIPNIGYQHFVRDYIIFAAKNFVVDITAGNQPNNKLFSFQADLTELNGAAGIVIASGFVDPSANQDGASFGLLFVLPDGTVVELPQIVEEPETARVQVIHNAADPAAAVVDIYVDTGADTIKIDDFAFRTATPFLDLPAETALSIVIAGGESESIADGIATFPATLEADESYYVVANGVLAPDDFAANPDGVETGFTLLVEAGAREAAESGEGVDLKVLHGATDAPNVGVNANGGVIIPGFSYTEFAGYLNVPADSYQLDVTLGGQPEAVVASFDADISGLGGGAAIVIASGFLSPADNQDGEAFGLIAVLPDGTVIELPPVEVEPETARVQVIHNAADPAAAVVDIYVDTGADTIKIDDFAFRTATPFLDLPAETALSIVIAGGESESIADGIATFPATLEADESYYVVANGVLAPDDFAANPDGVETGFTLLVEAGAREAAESGEGVDLKVLHGATDAPNVGVNANGGVIIPGFSYTEFAGYLNVPADSYQLDVTLGGQPEAVVASFDADISGLGGGAAIVIASGFLSPADNQDGEAFGLIAVLPDGTVIELPMAMPTARVQVIHNAADPAAEVVDIYVDTGADTIKIDDFAFRTATPFLDLPAETALSIVIAGGESESIADGIATFPATLEDGESYYVVANGVLTPDAFAANPDGVETGFTLLVEAGAREAAESGEGVDLKVLHGATDAPNVGVNANGATIIPGFSYTDFAGYLTVPADNYQLDITPGGDSATVLLSFNADISGLDGGAALVLASGFLSPADNQDGEAFGLIVVLPDGTVIVLPDAGTAGIQMIHNAADPTAATVDVYIDTGDEVKKVDNFSFQTATPFMDLPADRELTITVAGENSNGADEGIKTFNLTLESGKNYFVIANGLLNTVNFAANPMGYDTEFNLYVEEGARRISSGNNFDLKAFHGATDAPDVDVVSRREVTPIIDNLSYGSFSENVQLRATSYDLQITPFNNNLEVVTTFGVDLSDLKGKSGLLLATGFLNSVENQNGRPFNLMLTMQDGSTSMLSGIATSNDGLIQKDELLNVYPNPFSGLTTISYEVEIPGTVTFDIIDAMGRNVHREIFTNQGTGRYEWTLNGEKLETGVHTVIMSASNTRSIFKMIVR